MNPTIQHFYAFAVQGVQVRTSNAAEQMPEQAKIGGLWQQFFSAHGVPASTVYGVYSGYESDWTGAFDVTAGVQAAAGNSAKPNLAEVRIEAGQYIVFQAKGAMPQAVIQAWGQVWQYFAAPRSDWQRCYATDFEQYVGADEAQVCIGVRPA